MLRHLRRHPVAFGGLVVLVLLVAFGGWLAIRAFEAKSNLEAARNNAQQAKDALLDGDTQVPLRMRVTRNCTRSKHATRLIRFRGTSLPQFHG